MTSKHAFLIFFIALTGCDSINNFADRVGSHMPVIGERCEHWQCVTESGKQASEANKRMKLSGNPPAEAKPQPSPTAQRVTPPLPDSMDEAEEYNPYISKNAENAR